MAILFVTYELNAPGRDYKTLYDYLKTFTYCRGTEKKRLESSWLLDTSKTAATVRDEMIKLMDSNDVLFVTPIGRSWASFNYYCADWLNDPKRNWG